MAASLAFVMFFYLHSPRQMPPMMHAQNSEFVDTFDNPKEAAKAASEALRLLSENLNRGLVQTQKVTRALNRAGQFANKHHSTTEK